METSQLARSSRERREITMSQAGQTQNVFSLDLLSVGIVVLASALALIHFLLALSLGPPGLALIPLIFYLNAIGFVVLVIAYFVPALLWARRLLLWALILYAALTFALWCVMAFHRTAEGYLSEVLQIALIALLVIDDRRSAWGTER